ncbi:MAG: PepSY domain-containing protein [Chloroflexota bacterium]
MRIRATASVAALLLAACIGAGCTISLSHGSVAPASPSATPAPPPISADQAVAIVQKFAPASTDLHAVGGLDSASMGPYYDVEGKGVVATVDLATGIVTTLLLEDAMPQTAEVKLTPAEATDAASAFLAQHAIDVVGMAVTPELIDHGSMQEYAVHYGATINGIRLPGNLTVSVDPSTGRIYGLVHIQRSFVPPPAPKLTLEDATSAAKTEEKDPGLKVTESTLAVAFDGSGNQQLVWELAITRSDGFFVKLDVDAITGAVTVVGRG